MGKRVEWSFLGSVEKVVEFVHEPGRLGRAQREGHRSLKLAQGKSTCTCRLVQPIVHGNGRRRGIEKLLKACGRLDGASHNGGGMVLGR